MSKLFSSPLPIRPISQPVHQNAIVASPISVSAVPTQRECRRHGRHLCSGPAPSQRSLVPPCACFVTLSFSRHPDRLPGHSRRTDAEPSARRDEDPSIPGVDRRPTASIWAPHSPPSLQGSARRGEDSAMKLTDVTVAIAIGDNMQRHRCSSRVKRQQPCHESLRSGIRQLDVTPYRTIRANGLGGHAVDTEVVIPRR